MPPAFAIAPHSRRELCDAAALEIDRGNHRLLTRDLSSPRRLPLAKTRGAARQNEANEVDFVDAGACEHRSARLRARIPRRMREVIALVPNRIHAHRDDVTEHPLGDDTLQLLVAGPEPSLMRHHQLSPAERRGGDDGLGIGSRIGDGFGEQHMRAGGKCLVGMPAMQMVRRHNADHVGMFRGQHCADIGIDCGCSQFAGRSITSGGIGVADNEAPDRRILGIELGMQLAKPKAYHRGGQFHRLRHPWSSRAVG